MPAVTINQANLSANTKTSNLLAGRIFEFLDYDATVSIYAVSSASGANITFQAGKDVLIDDNEIIGIGTTLNEQDHLIFQDSISADTRLVLTLRETAGVATTDVLLKVVIEAE